MKARIQLFCLIAIGIMGMLPACDSYETPSARVARSLAASAQNVYAGDAYANQGANACSWTIGNGSIEKVLRFSSGRFTLTSFKNKRPATTREYIQGGVVSDELRFKWDGQTYTGASSGWTCQSGSASTIQEGGAAALQVNVALTRPGLRVTKHYVIYPASPLIREWVEYTNTGSSAHTLAAPSFLQQYVMASDVANVDLQYMFGADQLLYDKDNPPPDPPSPSGRPWTLETTPLTAQYARVFDSYDVFGCTSTSCAKNAFSETSENYIPWFGLWNRSTQDGIYMGFDYYGRWQAPIGRQNSKTVSLSMALSGYSKSLAAAETMTSPRAFTGVYATDLDDMTNGLLDWQYTYLWDYTREPYFAGIRMLGAWWQGTCWDEYPQNGWDPSGLLQKVFGLSDNLRAMGADTYHRDFLWFDASGSWHGPDWKLSNDYLAKMGMRELIYYHPYMANSPSDAYNAHPEWFIQAPKGTASCGYYATYVADLSIPDAASYVSNLLISNAAAWGDYQWRNDGCFMAPTSPAVQLAEDQAYRKIQKDFLDARPLSAIQTVNSGGNDISYESVRMSTSASFTDSDGLCEQYDASRIFPVDKLSGIPDLWSPDACTTAYNVLLMFNPDFTGEPSDPTAMECMRKLIDTYHYLKQEGVVGRWAHQYHPNASFEPRNWFQRVDWAKEQSLIIYRGAAPSGATTVYPKGLDPSRSYDLRYQIRGGSSTRTGASLMNSGINFSTVQVGELVYIGLPYHPGSGMDTTPPTAPSNVQVNAGVNMNYPGVEVSWSGGADDRWVSYYELFRNGKPLGKVAKGRYFFDHSPAADPTATYGVRTVDGNQNTSAIVSARGQGASTRVVDDAEGEGLGYSGGWTHGTWYFEAPYNGTISWTNEPGAAAEYTFVGSQVTWNTKLGRNCGTANVYVDGALDATIDTYAPDDGNWDIPIYSKSWGSVGLHSIKIQATGMHNSKSSDSYVHLDGLRILSSAKLVWEDASSSLNYSGTWSSCQNKPEYSNGNNHYSNQAGAYVEHDFNGSEIVWVGNWTPDGGEADVYIDAAFAARIDTFGYRGPSVSQVPMYRKTWSGNGNHTIRVVVAGSKNIESSNFWVDIDSFQVGSALQQITNDSSLTYTGSWSPVGTDHSFQNSDAHYTNEAGAVASATFSGTSVQVWGDRANNHGYADITLDNVYQGRIDAYASAATGGRQVLWQKDSLTNGTHSIHVVVAGSHNTMSSESYVTLDAIAYGTGASPRFTGYANDTAASYSANWSYVATDATYMNKDAHFSNVATRTASYDFTGTAVRVLGDRAPSHGYASVVLDGVFQGYFDTYFNGETGGSRALWQKDNLPYRMHTLDITVEGLHNSVATGTYVTLDGITFSNGTSHNFTNVVNDGAVTYSGAWSGGTLNTTFVNSDAHWTNVAGLSWSYTFSGTALQIASDRYSNHGYADVTIDGVYRGRYDGYSPAATGGRQIVWEIAGLANGSHTVSVAATGTKNPFATDSYVVLDALYTH